MLKTRRLSKSLIVESYQLNVSGELASLIFIGKKVGRPSKRLTLHQKGLKILGAKITKLDKKGEFEIPVARINHHKNFEEVRLHTDNLLFPGQYKIVLSYRLPDSKREHLKNLPLDRSIVPMIDEPEANKEVKIED